MKRALFYVLSLLLVSSCGSDWVPLSVDRNMGSQSAEEINSGSGEFVILDRDEYPEAYAMVRELRDKILESGKVKYANEFSWEIRIIKDDSIKNAFCLPGGYIYVFTGLMKYLPSEDALAGVMGHEMAHADLRHGTNQLIKNLGLGIALKWIFGSDNNDLINLGAQLVSLSFSREDEKDADLKSVEYLYNTDLDARGVSLFFNKISHEKNNPEIAEFLSTHPDPGNREQYILEKWKEMGAKKGKSYSKEYQEILSTLP